ncbi:MAG: radical SAM family heme chaperone HemW [Gammaproteobacteria bacterium]|nr:MAG: radical SAM family heme chaperone HemW [Gammaproteobacteria bacterium]
MLKAPPLSVYVHMPWCVRKCPYCDFNSHAVPASLPAEEYIQALIADLEGDLPLVWGRPVGSVYFGGGTPSLFSASHVAAFLSAMRARLDLRPDVEITLEANPGTVEHDSFTAYAQAGINRVSLGVQSFSDERLMGIGRIHGSVEIDQALQSLSEAGIANFNIDLMYALPGQSPAQSRHDVEMAINAGPAHISYYQLTIEPNTAFAAQPPLLPADDVAWDMQQAGVDMLEAAGYGQYEISAFARTGMQSRHNMNYWRYGDFLAVGAGAHGKISLPAEGVVQRYAKHRHPKRYLQGSADSGWLAEKRVVTDDERVFEFFLNQLRLKRGVYIDDFGPRTGLQWKIVETRVQKAIDTGLLEVVQKRLRPTSLGWKFVNDIQQMFLP